MIDKVALPTVGRIIHYHHPDHVDPFAGIVAVAVPNRYTIPYLHIFLHDGVRVVNDVKHKDCVKLAKGEAYWDWMDYQKGQAAKTEALQAELERNMSAQKTRPLPVTAVDEVYGMAKNVGKAADASLDELYKTQSSTPSPVDGKR